MNLTPADQVLREIEKAAKIRNLPIVGPHKGQVIMDIIRKNSPRRLLEVGTLIGYSTILMAKELGKEAEIITIEIDPDEAEQAEINIQKAKVHPHITLLVGNALRILPTIEGEFDLVFIDAEKHEYLQYLKLIEAKLHPESIIIADNAGIYAQQMNDYLHYVRTSPNYTSTYIPIGVDGLEISTRH
ncbi:MAG: O-methyltransferase [Candidatus Hermodarchaeia archaeon]|jgi:predicted O-methyltransferase YrrM